MSTPEIRLLRAADYPRMPWRNGGGTTQEVACNPGGSTAAFDWRVSIADVAQDGGFSAFTGYQRIITVLEGQGIVLTVDGQAHAPLPARQPYAFSGDARVDCRLVDGPIRDFNLIYSPARYEARLQWVKGGVAAPWILRSAARSVLVLNAGAGLTVTIDGVVHALPSRYDCLHVEGQNGLAEYRLDAVGTTSPAILDACVIELFPRQD